MTAQERRQRWQELTTLLDRAERRGVAALSPDELRRVCRLYRHVTIDLSRARADGGDRELVIYLNALAARAHGWVYQARRIDLRPLFAFLITGFPELVRRHARPVLAASALFVLTGLASFIAVVRQPELAYSLFDENMVEFENVRLEKQQGEFKGNFTFELSDSPFVAAAIIGNNIRVAVLAF